MALNDCFKSYYVPSGSVLVAELPKAGGGGGGGNGGGSGQISSSSIMYFYSLIASFVLFVCLL